MMKLFHTTVITISSCNFIYTLSFSFGYKQARTAFVDSSRVNFELIIFVELALRGKLKFGLYFKFQVASKTVRTKRKSRFIVTFAMVHFLDILHFGPTRDFIQETNHSSVKFVV